MSYGYFRIIKGEFDAVENRIREELSENGFGVITEIDVRQTIKNKLDIDIKPYKILGACNPSYAHRALTDEPDIGLLLPCNIIIEDDQKGSIRVGAIDVEKMMNIVENNALREFAGDINELLRKSIDSI